MDGGDSIGGSASCLRNLRHIVLGVMLPDSSESAALRLPILKSDDVEVTKALKNETFRYKFPIDKFPLIYDMESGSMVMTKRWGMA